MVELKSLTNDHLICETKSLVSKEREITASVLNYLAEIYRRRLYLDLGFSSLFMFCVKSLGYTESQAQRRIEAMRTLKEIPQIEEKIKTGSLSLTALAQAQTFFRQQETPLHKKIEVLEKLENKTTRECEKTLMALAPIKDSLPKEKIKEINQDFTQVVSNIPSDLMTKLEKLKKLLSHKNPKMTHVELLEELAEMALAKLDPEKRRVKQREASTAPKVTHGRYVSQNIKREVWQKNRGRCSFVGVTGQKCDSTYQLQIDHRQPFSLGGTNDPENLRLLCSGHNRSEAKRILGEETMGRYLKN